MTKAEIELETTPVIHADDITAQKYLGFCDSEESGETHFVLIETKHGDFLIAGGTCNAGLLPSYAMAIDPAFSTDEILSEMWEDIQELERGGIPSGELLAWHGSLVI